MKDKIVKDEGELIKVMIGQDISEGVKKKQLTGFMEFYTGSIELLLSNLLHHVALPDEALMIVLENDKLRGVLNQNLQETRSMMSKITSHFCLPSQDEYEPKFERIKRYFLGSTEELTGPEMYNKVNDIGGVLVKEIKNKEETNEFLTDLEKNIPSGIHYIAWWIRGCLDNTGNHLKAKVDDLKSQIRTHNSNIISKYEELPDEDMKRRLDARAKRIENYDIVKDINWRRLQQIIKAIAPQDSKTLSELEKFFVMLKDKVNHPEVQFLQYYIIANTDKPVKRFLTLYNACTPPAKPLQAIHKVLFNMKLDDIDDNIRSLKDLCSLDIEGYGYEATEAVSLFKYMISTYINFQVLANSGNDLIKNFNVTSKEEPKKELNINNEYLSLYPKADHARLFEMKFATFDNSEIKVCIPLTEQHKKIYMYSFCVSLVCLNELDQIDKAKIKMAEIKSDQSNSYAIAARENRLCYIL